MLLYCDSFDHYATANIGLKHEYNSSCNINTVFQRTGAGCIAGGQFRKNLVSNAASLFVGFAYRPALPGAGWTTILQFQDNGSAQISLEMSSTGALRITHFQSGTVYGTTGNTILATDVYAFIEIAATFSNTIGTVQLRVNEQPLLSVTGLDTVSTANAYANQVYCSMPASYLDDLYVCDETGSVNNGFLGDCRVHCLLPSAEGATNDFTPSTGTDNAALVDDLDPNADTDYVASSTAGHIDLYAYPDPTITGPIKAVQVLAACRKDDAGVRTVATMVRHSGVNYEHADAPSINNTYAFQLRQIWEMNPGTTLAWTSADINAAQFGIKVVS